VNDLDYGCEFSRNSRREASRDLRPMQIFAEKFEELSEIGIYGFDLTLNTSEMPISPSLVEFAQKYHVTCKGDPRAFDVALLSENGDDSVYVNIHGHLRDTKVNGFRLMIARRPDNTVETPENYLKTSEALGGFPTGMHQAFEALGVQSVKFNASLEAFILDRKKWPIPFRRRSVPKSLKPFYESDRTKFRINETEVEVEFFEHSGISLTIEGEVELETNPDCFSVACGILWKRIEVLFRPL